MRDSPEPAGNRKRLRRAIQTVVSLALIAAIFFYALPQFADFSKVWQEIRAMTWLEGTTLVLAAVWSIATYWLVMVASLPGSNFWQAMKINQTSTAVSNTIPAGSAIGIGITYSMYSAYGFSRNDVGLSVLVSGVWNNFVKLGMPIVALALLALEGNADGGLVVGAVVGVVVLALSVGLFAMSLRSDDFARRAGERIGRTASPAMKLLKKPEASGWGEGLVRFRRDALQLLKRRWLPLTAATLISHTSLFVVLLLALRHLDVPASQVTAAEALAAFAFIRLISALPITPGGLGVVELGLTAALVAAGGPKPEVVAAVLVYRILTYVAPIPFGLIAYLEYKRGSKTRAVGADVRRAERAAFEDLTT